MITAEQDQEIYDLVAQYRYDPLGYVLAAYTWGEGELAEYKGPYDWQRTVLIDLGKALEAGTDWSKAVSTAIKIAVASGHGIGKSALVCWIIMWAMSTCADTRGIVTANTDTQLRTKTWPELAKWHRLAINGYWFKYTATALHAVDPAHEKNWRIDATPWSEHNTTAFAGLHNKGKRLLLVFDEASEISDKIWEVAEGALTDERTEIVWVCFGNPTVNVGRFRECFGRLAHRWDHKQIDSRTVDGTNKAQIQQWIEDYGEDSDFVRVRVKGMFPRASAMQFIPSDLIQACAARTEVSGTLFDPIIIGVDVARFGDDESVIKVRRGPDAHSIPAEMLRGQDTMALVGRVAALANQYRANMIFVDETGVGAGVVDRLQQLGFSVIGVNNGSKPDRFEVGSELIGRKDAEMWATMRDWMKTGGAIENDPDLHLQLEGRDYSYNSHNAIMLEPKDVMKKRGLSSPDRADALALTFAFPVQASRDLTAERRKGSHTSVDPAYDPYKDA